MGERIPVGDLQRCALTAIILGLSCGTLAAQSACTSQCPPCLNNFVSGIQGHGTYQGRTIYNVYVDSSWLSDQSSVAQNAQTAMTAWNNQIDSNSCYGRPYINFWLQPTNTNSNADITIVKGSVSATDCASTALYAPYTITFPRPSAASASGIEHEFGHLFGLNDTTQRGSPYPAPQPDCSQAQSIMSGVTDVISCVGVANQVLTGADVAQANLNLTNHSACETQSSNGKESQDQAPCPTGPSCGAYLNPDYCTYGQDNEGCPSGASIIPGSQGQDCCSTRTPIVIDLKGNGFDITTAKGGVLFDFFGDGKKIQISWTAANSDDAWLVLDRNGNGLIDNGLEMFGNLTPQPPSEHANGFLALAEFDKPENGGNGDGVIDLRDSVFARLRLWLDRNHDGISQPEELYRLDQAGVTAINLSYQKSSWVDLNGNAFRYRARIERSALAVDSSATVSWAYDVFLLEINK